MRIETFRSWAPAMVIVGAIVLIVAGAFADADSKAAGHTECVISMWAAMLGLAALGLAYLVSFDPSKWSRNVMKFFVTLYTMLTLFSAYELTAGLLA